MGKSYEVGTVGPQLANTRISHSDGMGRLPEARKAHVPVLSTNTPDTQSTEEATTAQDRGTQVSGPAMTLGLHLPCK